MVGQCRKWNDQTSIASVTYALALSSPQALSSSLRSEAVCSVNCFNAEWGIRCLVVSTESRSRRRRPRRRDDSLGLFGVSDNTFSKLPHHPGLSCPESDNFALFGLTHLAHSIARSKLGTKGKRLITF